MLIVISLHNDNKKIEGYEIHDAFFVNLSYSLYQFLNLRFN